MKNQKGFTLIELLIVLAVIAILATVAMGGSGGCGLPTCRHADSEDGTGSRN